MSELQTILQEVCQFLIEEGRLFEPDYRQALKVQENEDGYLDDILVGMGILSEEILQRAIAIHLDCYFMDAEQIEAEFSENKELLKIFLSSFVQEHVFLPLLLDKEKKTLRIVASRLPSKAFLTHLSRLAEVEHITFDLSTRSIIAAIIYQYYFPHSNRRLSKSSEIVPEDSKEQTVICPECEHICSSELLVCEQCGEPLREEMKGHYLQKGTLIGPFQIERIIGTGGMAEVYLATDLRNDAQVALKTLQSQLSSVRSAIQRFQQEARALKQLDHPGIVRFFEFGFQEKIGMYIATEYLEGREFLELLQTGEATSLEALQPMVEQVCDALDYAHQHEIIHRDLKPDNIIITKNVDGSDGLIKLIDFGIAKILDDSMVRTQTGLVLGTPRYMSPEQVSNNTFDHRADIYSLAVILFEALTNNCLFEAENGYQMMMKQLYTSPPLLSDIRPELNFPPDLVFLIDQSLSKEPNERPDSMKEFKSRFVNTVEEYKLSKESSFEDNGTFTEFQENEGLLLAPNNSAHLFVSEDLSDNLFSVPEDISAVSEIIDEGEDTMLSLDVPSLSSPQMKVSLEETFTTQDDESAKRVKKNKKALKDRATMALSIPELVSVEALINYEQLINNDDSSNELGFSTEADLFDDVEVKHSVMTYVDNEAFSLDNKYDDELKLQENDFNSDMIVPVEIDNFGDVFEDNDSEFLSTSRQPISRVTQNVDDAHLLQRELTGRYQGFTDPENVEELQLDESGESLALESHLLLDETQDTPNPLIQESNIELLNLEEQIDDWESKKPQEKQLLEQKSTQNIGKRRKQPINNSLSSSVQPSLSDKQNKKIKSLDTQKNTSSKIGENKKMKHDPYDHSTQDNSPSTGSIAPIPDMDWSSKSNNSNDQYKKKQKKTEQSASVFFAGAVKFAVYALVIGVVLYFGWIFYNNLDDDNDVTHIKPLITAPLNAQTTRRISKKHKTHPSKKKRRVFECDGHWERQHRLIWKWSKKQKEYVMRRKWMKVCVPSKRRKKKSL